ncbi:MAG: tetratricopeptide repeat protein [Candidatus Acidiferrales bacterium]
MALCLIAASAAARPQQTEPGQDAPPQAPASQPQPKHTAPAAPADQAAPDDQSNVEPRRAPVSIEPSLQLFATMCALDAAGFDPDGGGTPARVELRAKMEALHGPSVDALRKFYQDHELADPGSTLSRYIAYALAMGPPPVFEIQVHREDVSPDALALEGFGAVLSNFYAEGHIEDIWHQVEPQYESAVTSVTGPVSNVLYVTSGYLREVINPRSPQTFTVYVEPLVGAHSNFLNLGDEYDFVLDPGRGLPLDEIRHAFLHFFLDPLAYRFHNTIVADAPLLGVAVRAPRLPQEYDDDFTSYFTECLVRAVELRLDRPSDLEARLASEDADGYVLVRPLVTQLMSFEKTQPPMNLYYPDLVHGINVAAEMRRLAGVQFAPRTAEVARPHIAVGYADNADLIEGEAAIAANDANSAAASFERVLTRHPGESRALFGLAVASLMQSRAERAEQLFLQIVAAAPGAGPASGTGSTPATDAPTDPPDARTLSWSHVYLGRLYDVQGNRDQAVAEYRAALSVEGAPDAAKAAAQKGVDQGFQAPQHTDDPGNAKP